MSDYDTQANAWLTKHGIRFTAKHAQAKSHQWSRLYSERDSRRQHWTVALRSPGRHSLRFDFWNSQHDTDQGIPLSAYSVLVCLSSDASLPTDPNELIDELGAMPVKQALASCRFTERINKWLGYFPDDTARDELMEIA